MAGWAPREESTESAEENAMKLRCFYCHTLFECAERPPACPHCAVPFSITITPETPVFEIAMAVEKNGYEATFNLKPRNAPLEHKVIAVFSTSKDAFELAAGPEP